MIQELCGSDRRVFMRIGALLHERLAVSELTLRELANSPGLRELLLDGELSTIASADWETLLSGHGLSGLGLLLHETDEQPSWRVIAFADEIDNPLLTMVEATDQADTTGVSALLPRLSKELRQPIEGLLEARADDQRAAALEQLRYAAPPLTVVGELMPVVLADTADLVRERAISLLVAAGARSVVVDIIRALQTENDAQIVRLVDKLHGLPSEQTDLVLAAILATVGRGRQSSGIIALCRALAEPLARHRGLPRLLELLLPAGSRLGLVGFVRAVQEHDRDGIDAILRSHFGQSPENDAALIVLLAHPDGLDDPELLARGLDLLLNDGDQPRDRLGLAAALRRLDAHNRLPDMLTEQAQDLIDCRDPTPFWLIGELARDDLIDCDQATSLFDTLVVILKEAPGSQLAGILEHQLLPALPAPTAHKEAAVPLLGDLIARFRDRRSRDLARLSLAGMGPGISDALWRLIDEHPSGYVRLTATEILPELLLQTDIDPTPAIDRFLTTMRGMSERAEQGACLVAAARLSQAESCTDPEATERVDQATRGMGEQAIGAWGYLCAGSRIDPNRRSEILECLLVAITTEVPDSEAEHYTDSHTQEATYVLDDRLGAHTDSVPAMLTALERIGRSPHLPPPLLRRLVSELCRLWQRLSRWEIIWGPGNVQELALTLGRLSRGDVLPANLRLQIVEALMPRIDQLAIAAILAKTFGCIGDSTPLAEAAGRAARRLLQAADGTTFADDELGELAEVLIDFVAVEHLGEDGDLLRRRLAGLLSGHRSHLGTRGIERLRKVLPELPDDVANRLSWAASV